MMTMGSKDDAELFWHWAMDKGKDKDKEVGFDLFDGKGEERAGAWSFTKSRTENLTRGLKCGESTTLPRIVFNNTTASATTLMISGYTFQSDCTCTATKRCDVQGCCKQIAVTCDCDFHATDFVEFWNKDTIQDKGGWDEGGMFGYAGIRIADRLIRACFPGGKGFCLTANESERQSWSLPCP